MVDTNLAKEGRRNVEHTSIFIDIDKDADGQLASSIQAKLPDSSPCSSESCIFKVPVILRRHNEAAFSPNTVAIGPHHRGRKSLKHMEKVKQWYLHELLSRAPTTPNTTLKCLIKAIREFERSIRESYAESLQIESSELIEMFIIDGCFIVELFRREAGQVDIDKDDPIFNMSFTLGNLSRDLMLLENQVPWFVLDCVFNLTVGAGKEKITLTVLALNFFRRVLPLTVGVKVDSLPHGTRHLLDLLRNSLMFSRTAGTEPKYPAKWELIPCATNLVNAGVELRVGIASEVLSVRFEKGVLEIPPVIIHEDSEALFRNLIAYEQCDNNCSDKVASYVVLLDCLINSEKDVELLSSAGILRNWLSQEDACLMFKRLHNDASVNEFQFGGLCQEVNAYYRANTRKFQVVLKHRYLKTPWVPVSLVGASLLLMLCFLQTLFSMLEYFN